ncbi:MAG: lipid-A-disaccharide synthase [Candidatus Lambdaproteobacteria bacterium RIFOXYD1_FULL_56_27]|uniref:Lipid-A-disaccharide synthase n=1 Tax=Candidatus Lambdaproteobacteria bacterium RIFOXYD2_FULL_56_26 TaxID=1817773 RepID=A0A1F6GVJ9_9PROT|nr:MAG: lipid-A-disaccharide synthase [Candidatus Lambdaproteobacteria bacterium RIFOXYD2_FULL_56_26]OGH03747.1 MAG: lipid-A-disaccharide synthase [Candidatus Lambdaproteobacteria bacterium RIFOXYC1_FULL_56_13]OGH07331.1 MAG: lipid-A-disaccharide synthase [Candidatus Lambdaproteobacteria bacterium RIFOXYD1_FULL_56_27]
MIRLMVIAGEASGDLHGGHVLGQLKTLIPDLEAFGTGGPLLAEAGVELYYRAEEMAVIGFKEVLKNYSFYKSIFDKMVSLLDQRRPDAVFLVDYAGFNLRFAKEAKKRGIPVVFYVAPQVWAWKKGRIKEMKKVIDHLIVLFPFEVEFFAQEGILAQCFGHPLLDIVKPTQSRADFCTKMRLDPQKKLVALLPGSRRNEVAKHLPVLVEMANHLAQQLPGVQFVYPLAPTVAYEEVQSILGQVHAPLALAQGETYNAVAAADFAVVASGTATLETAILETPLLIFYKVAATTYAIGKYLLGIKAIGLPNIILGESLVPELVQSNTDPKVMADLVYGYLQDPAAHSVLKAHLKRLREKLGLPGAYQKTAQTLGQLLLDLQKDKA